MKPLTSLPEIAIRVGREEIALQAREAAIVALLARHRAAITSATSLKVIFDCSASDVALTIQAKLGQLKIKR